jgi:hypothetical protein
MNSPRPRVRPAVPGARSVDTGPVLFLLFALSSRAHQRFTNLWWIPTGPSEGGGVVCLIWKTVISLQILDLDGSVPRIIDLDQVSGSILKLSLWE